MLVELQLQTLAERRKNARLSLFYRALSEESPLQIPDNIIVKETQRRTDNGRACHSLPICKNNIRSHSFYPRTLKEWNSLPREAVCKLTLDSFKEFLLGKGENN